MALSYFQGFGSSCSCMFDFLLPVIQISTDVTQDQYIYLVEDGLELWHVTLQNTTVSTEHILRLYSNMAGLLGRSFLPYVVGDISELQDYLVRSVLLYVVEEISLRE